MQIAMEKTKFVGVSWVFAVKNSGKSFMQRGPGERVVLYQVSRTSQRRRICVVQRK